MAERFLEPLAARLRRWMPRWLMAGRRQADWRQRCLFLMLVLLTLILFKPHWVLPNRVYDWYFVVDITPDFEEIYYRIRSIDFDQQSYEGKKAVYLPQYFKQNNAIIELGMKCLTNESVLQYQREERSLIAGRIRVERSRIQDLMNVMMEDQICLPDNLNQLKTELAQHYRNNSFLQCRSMGEVVMKSLELVLAH